MICVSFTISCLLLALRCQAQLQPSSPPQSISSTSNGSLLNFDECFTSDQCRVPRRCISLFSKNERVCIGIGTCFCYAKLRCSDDEDGPNYACAPGEICYKGLCESAKKHNMTTSEQPEQTVSGLAFEKCSSENDCAPNYQCVLNLGNNTRLTCPAGAPQDACSCHSANFTCLSSSQCHPQEFCLLALGAERAGCISKRSLQLFEPSVSLPPDDARNGTLLSFESCNSTLDCAPPRECIRALNGTNVVCEQPHADCVCQPQMPSVCHINSFCERGETCVFLDGLSGTFCKASTLVEQHNSSHAATKLSLERCAHTWECVARRRCATFVEGALFDECNGRSGCFCLDREYRCFRDDECLPDERCERFEGVSACVARAVVASGDIPKRELLPLGGAAGQLDEEETVEGDEETSVRPSARPVEIPPEHTADAGDDGAQERFACVAVHHLRWLRAEQLLYGAPRRATVLCDALGNCATRGHMLVVRGSAMSMATYCGGVRCERRTMWVNSPRYVARLRVRGFGGVTWTPFAAAFGTALEESALAALVALGF